MIRRIKEDVMKDLPKLTKTVLAFEIENRKEYEYAELDFLRWLASYDLAAADRAARNERLTRFNYLKRLAIKCKMASVMSWIDDFLANSDGKLILGALHRKTWPHTINMIEEKYKNSVSVHGGKTKLRKQDAIDQFQNDPKTRIITLQLKSGGTGYNLQGAKRSMGLIEMPWHPADVTQFIGRGHRIGTLDAVNCWFFLAASTIEEKLCAIIQKKSKIYDNTIDGKEATFNSLNLLDELHLAMLKGTAVKKKRKKC
jgi:SWI/SNF-related matrix-associated actin-dependent regulator 1 of chromatin subfamily A